MKKLPSYESIIYYKIYNDNECKRVYSILIRELDYAIKNNKNEVVIIDKVFNNDIAKNLFADLLEINNYIFYFEDNVLKIILNNEYYEE